MRTEVIKQLKSDLKKSFLSGLIKELTKKFPKSEIYLVGGAVRDLLLGRQTKDFDFVIRNVSADDLEKFLSKLGQVNLVGKSFGVFKFVPTRGDPRNPIDIALPRREHAFGTGGYRDFEIQSDPCLPIEKDLERRDFTINAIALRITNLNELRIVDPFGGQKDLDKKIIRAVGKSEERFKEDYSRMLRAIRFACQFNFQIEEKTWQAIKKSIIHLNDVQRNVKLVGEVVFAEPEILENRTVPYEVIAKEFLKAFYSQPIRAFDLYDQSGAFKEIMPEILKMKNCPQPKNWHSEGDVWAHTRLCLKYLLSKEFKNEFGNEPAGIELILGVLFHDAGKPYTIKTPEKDKTDRIRFNDHDEVGARLTQEICLRLKFSSPQEISIDPERVARLVCSHMIFMHGNPDEMKPGTIEKYFFNPKYSGQDLMKLAFVDALATVPAKGKPDLNNYYQMKKRIESLKAMSQNKKELPKPILSGHQIMKELKLRPGKRVGQILAALREKQLSGQIKNKDQALRFLKKIYSK